MIPTAWYPNSLALGPDGKQLAIGVAAWGGVGMAAEFPRGDSSMHIGSQSMWSNMPDAAQLANYTTAVAENNRMTADGGAKAALDETGSCGDPVARRRSFAHRACGLHHQGESHL